MIDEIVPEPLGGAHVEPGVAVANLKDALVRQLDELCALDVEALLAHRWQKYERMGTWLEGVPVA